MPYQTTSHLLTWITFAPIAGSALIVLLALARGALKLSKNATDNLTRLIALGASAASLAGGVELWLRYNAQDTNIQFVHHLAWIPSYKINYFVAVDGISISMVLLTVLISFIAVIASMPWWGAVDDHHFSKKMVPGYMALILLLETGMLGTFVALDFFLFFVFWELMLLPMYFLIGIWGGPRKEYAAIKFFLYTLSGSVLMLLAIIALYYNGPGGERTFDMLQLAEWGRQGHWATIAPLFGMEFAKVLWIGLFIGFAIKVPMFPFHTWLPDAHVEAPTPVSVILAGVLLKMGVYGMLRVNWAILPQTTWDMRYVVAVFGTINIVYAAFVCMAQKDLKKLIAYSSVSHMGFCLLGMAAMTQQGMDGAVLQMWNHGIISAMLFLIAGVIYDRAHHREIEGFGGLAAQIPEYTGMMGLAFFASMGLPGLAGFISEALVFMGAFSVFTALTIISATAVVITAAYYLWTIQRMFLGKLNEKYKELPDLFWRERFTLYPLAAITVIMGFYPHVILDLVQGGLGNLIRHVKDAAGI